MTPDLLIDAISQFPSAFQFRTEFLYSNMCYATAGMSSCSRSNTWEVILVHL
jgi:hypothetical protein